MRGRRSSDYNDLLIRAGAASAFLVGENGPELTEEPLSIPDAPGTAYEREIPDWIASIRA